MTIQHHISLQPYNTFGINAIANSYVNISTKSELKEVLENYKNKPKFILGGGSNMLLTKNVDALVMHINLKGKELVEEDDLYVWIKAQAGENWHEFVLWTLAQNYGGIENLSLIPGHIGTAPIQNIGAYGVELKDVFFSCEAINMETLEEKTFTLEACDFDYRSSIFKTVVKGMYIITSVTLRLTKQAHQLHTEYGAIQQELALLNIKEPTITDVSRAVINIRQSKLPDPKQIGNSGSFFKNPVISKTEFIQFQSKHPEAPFYKVSESEFKIPAGWLIEQSGFKGQRFGDAGVHDKQALVLVNHGNATGEEIWNLAVKIQETVFQNFNINIEAEVNIV